jgi:hypothetical protein
MKIAIGALILVLYTYAIVESSYKIGYMYGVCDVLQSLLEEKEEVGLDPLVRVTGDQAELARILQG